MVGPLADYTPRQRLKGFKKCMEEKGISVAKESIVEVDGYSMQKGYNAALELLKKNKNLTALFSTNFDMTLGIIKATNELGLKIPDDISLMAFDCLEIYEVITPKLWTINQPVEAIGEQVVSQVLNRLSSSDDSPHTTHFVGYELKEGESIKRLK